ncbi:MAG: hypothetical protein ACFCBW_05575 [Candidatus Competibacterales bacterium]
METAASINRDLARSVMPHGILDRRRHWQVLRVFTLYRLVFAALAAYLVFERLPLVDIADSGLTPQALDQTPPALLVTTLVYFALAGLLLGLSLWRRPVYLLQIHLGAVLDVAFITIAMGAAPLLYNNLVLVLFIAVAASAMLLPQVSALVIALAAAVGAAGAGWFHSSAQGLGLEHVIMGSVLGGVLVASSFAVNRWARETRIQEQVLRAQTLSLIDMAKLHEKVIQRLTVGVLVVDSAGRVQLINHRAQEVLGVEAKPGVDVPLETLAPSVWQRLQAWREGGGETRADAPSFERLGAGADAPTLVVLAG